MTKSNFLTDTDVERIAERVVAKIAAVHQEKTPGVRAGFDPNAYPGVLSRQQAALFVAMVPYKSRASNKALDSELTALRALGVKPIATQAGFRGRGPKPMQTNRASYLKSALEKALSESYENSKGCTSPWMF